MPSNSVSMLKAIGLSEINRLLVFIILVSVILYFGREFFVLITFSGFLAMLMMPVSNKLESYRVPRLLSSLISVIIIVVVISGVIFLLSAQIRNVIQEIPHIKSDVQDLINEIKSRISEKTSIEIQEQVSNLKDGASGAIGTAGNIIAGTVKGTFTLLGSFLLVLVFTFLFLLQREKYERFIVMLFKPGEREEAAQAISSISKVAHKYLQGRLIAILIIAILNAVGFLIIGVKNGLLLALIAALLAIIPYVGPLIGGIVPLTMTLIEGSYSQALEVIIVILIVNLIDHYFIEPYIVGGSIKISPFFTIIALILGGVFWGLAGIVLFLPMIGILKIIFEKVDGLKVYANLIGDNTEKVEEEV